MKAIMKGDQTLPLKAISKETLNRKDTAARDPGARFNEVLSGLAETRNSSAKTRVHRATESTTIAAESTAELNRPRSNQALDSIPHDSPLADDNAPVAAAHPHEATGSAHADRTEFEPAIAELHSVTALVPVGVQIAPIDPMPAAPQNEDADPALTVTAPQFPTREIAGHLKTSAPTIRSDASDDPLTDCPVAAARAVFELDVRVDTLAKQPIAFTPGLGAELARSATVLTGPLIQTEQATQLSARTSSRVQSETVFVLRNEKHLSPIAPATPVAIAAPLANDEPATQPTSRLPEMATQAVTQWHRTNPAVALDSPRLPNERRSPAASRVDLQIASVAPLASPIQQIATAIDQELAPRSAPLASAAEPPSLLTESTKHAPLRVLKVALEPAELGHITVNLRLTGETLEMKVTAERAETASMLDRDRHLLSRALEASGYGANDVTIQSAATSSQPASSFTRATADGQSDAQVTPQAQSNGSAEGERRSARQESEQRHSRQETEREKQGLDPWRGDLYV
jgi:hypothetical protein